MQVNIAAMRVACSIHGLRPPVKGIPKTVAVLVPGTGELAVAGEGALLQIFDASRNRHIDKVQVWCQVQSRKAARTSKETHMVNDCSATRREIPSVILP